MQTLIGAQILHENRAARTRNSVNLRKDPITFTHQDSVVRLVH
jgi:hypothetical protein